MLKSLIILPLILLSFTASATTYGFKCRTPKDFKSDGWVVQAGVHGFISQLKPGKFILTYRAKYKIDCTPTNCWGKDNLDGETFNDPKYRPRKYKGYLKFELKDNSTTKNDYGNFLLIIPPLSNTIVKKGQRFKFKAAFIMSYVNDHFGTTAPLICTAAIR